MNSRTQPTIQIGFGEVRHKRLRPVLNAFCYRAFFVRLAAHESVGAASGNWLVGVNRAALLSVHEHEHGDGRGIQWVAQILAEHGQPRPARLWLHAFPRVLGYAFKPVSFWFCEHDDGVLYAVLAEVHNTFGERHCYLLCNADGSAIGQGRELRASKSFHVSPFCEVAGDYRFRFMNTGDRACARIDYDDEQGCVLQTSISGRLTPLTVSAALRALIAFPLFTFGVIARIHWQAFRLWRHRVPVRAKPPKPGEFVTRGSV